MKKNKLNNQNGQIIIVGLVFFAIILFFSAALITQISTNVKSERQSILKDQALQLAEAGMDKAAYQLNQNSNYSGESNTVLGEGTFTITVSDVNSSTKRITSTGYVPNSINPRSVRIVKANVVIGNSVISFNYGVQAGNGGFELSGGSTVNGNIYSNGNIVATNGVHITGSATAANPPDVSADQSNDSPMPVTDCPGSGCVTFANSNSTQDFAQSFKLSTSVSINNIQFYIKKTGSPSNISVKIVSDDSGNPGTDVLLSGTLLASQVTTNFGWIPVTFPATPILNAGQTYWMILDASSNPSKYYTISTNSNGYINGSGKLGKYGDNWNDTSPAGLDGYFQIYLGGGTSTIGGSNYVGGVYVGTTADDIAWAHNVQGASVTGSLYCQVGSNNNKTCDTSRSDPTPQPMPLSDANIQDWKDDASLGDSVSSFHVDSAGATLGPKVIDGDLLIDGGGTLTVTGTLYIKGNIHITGGGIIRLDHDTYGASNGIIVSDGYILIDGGSNFYGSGESGSYPFVITTSSCPAASGCDGYNAIELSGGSGTVSLIAQDGNININGGTNLKAVTGKQITMSGGATLEYDSGLINSNFTSGPGGSWQFQPGSYVIVK
jgi:Tfp pilus assembly protein PilX